MKKENQIEVSQMESSSCSVPVESSQDVDTELDGYDVVGTGKRIQQLREEQSMTQEQLAEYLHISDRHMRRIENGDKGASVDTLIKISSLFDVSLDRIIKGQKTKEELALETLKRELNATKQELTYMAQRLTNLLMEL